METDRGGRRCSPKDTAAPTSGKGREEPMNTKVISLAALLAIMVLAVVPTAAQALTKV
jgi:hypothetical protein